MATLTRGLGPLLTYFRTKRAGDRFTIGEISAAVGWKPNTFRTYISKNKLATVVAADGGPGSYRMLVDGERIQPADIAGALTQKSERRATVMKGQLLEGRAGEYALVRQLGEGAVGQVWEARTTIGNTGVAIKVCSPRPDLLEATVFANVKDRFRREYSLGPKVKHARVVDYLDYGEVDGFPFLVMELAEGTLQDILSARGTITLDESLTVVGELLAALAHIHAQSCVHRDIKPANILRTARGFVLGDFGIVRWGDLSRSFTSAGTITRASVQLGSWHYMAPEQLEQPHSVSAASDVYSLGITWIEMLTGEAPHPHRVAAGLPAAV